MFEGKDLELDSSGSANPLCDSWILHTAPSLCVCVALCVLYRLLMYSYVILKALKCINL